MATLITNVYVKQNTRIALAENERFEITPWSNERRIVTAVVFMDTMARYVAHKIRKNGQPFETGTKVYVSSRDLPDWLAGLYAQHVARLDALKQAVEAVAPLPAEVEGDAF